MFLAASDLVIAASMHQNLEAKMLQFIYNKTFGGAEETLSRGGGDLEIWRVGGAESRRAGEPELRIELSWGVCQHLLLH